MGLDTSVAGGLLKKVYEPDMREQLNNEVPALKFFVDGEMDDGKWEGDSINISLHTGRNASGVKAIAIDSGLLPVAGNQATTLANVPIRKWMGRIQLTADIIAKTQSDRGAFMKAVVLEQEKLVDDLSRQRNRGINYFGTATLATVSPGANSITQTLTAPGGVTGTTNIMRFIQVGMLLAFTSSDGTILRGVQKVVSVNNGAGTLVLDSALNTTTGDLVSIGTNSAAPGESSYNLEPYGMLALVDATTYQSNIFGIDRSQAANAYFQSTVLTSVGSLNPDLLNRVIDNNEEISGRKIANWYAHNSIKREFYKLTEQDKRYNVAPGDKGASFQAGPSRDGSWGFGGIDGTADRDAAYGTLFGLSEGHFKRYTLGTTGWADDDNTVFLRLPNQDAYEARYRLRENFFNDQPNSCSRLDGVTASVTSGAFQA